MSGSNESRYVRVRNNLLVGAPSDLKWLNDIRRILHPTGPYYVREKGSGSVDLSFGENGKVVLRRVPACLVEPVRLQVSL